MFFDDKGCDGDFFEWLTFFLHTQEESVRGYVELTGLQQQFVLSTFLFGQRQWYKNLPPDIIVTHDGNLATIVRRGNLSRPSVKFASDVRPFRLRAPPSG